MYKNMFIISSAFLSFYEIKKELMLNKVLNIFCLNIFFDS